MNFLIAIGILGTILGVTIVILGALLLVPAKKCPGVSSGNLELPEDPNEVFRQIGLIVNEVDCDRMYTIDALAVIDKLAEHGMSLTSSLLTND